MTFEEILIEAGEKRAMPKVKLLKPITNLKSNIGTVTNIKNTENYKGIAVQFEGCDWNNWFYAETENDRRKNYMSELEILYE